MPLTIIRRDLWIPEEVAEFNPKSELGKYVKTLLKYLPYEQARELMDRISRTLVIESSLAVRILFKGVVLDDMGIVSRKVVTTAGVNFLVDGFRAAAGFDIGLFKYHGIGTGGTAELPAQTLLAIELTTQYSPTANARIAGSQTEGTTANIYKTVGTNTVSSAVVIAEHGIFSGVASGAITLWDRSLVSPTASLNASEAIETSYELTCNTGG